MAALVIAAVAGLVAASVLFGPDSRAPVFAEEFEGAALDFGRWQSGYPWGCNNETTEEQQCYTADALEVRDGRLRITADRAHEGDHPFTSGMITSYPSFSQAYGYFQMRAELPAGKGLWPAFWLLPKDTAKWPPELDVMEHIGSEPDTVHMTQHYGDGPDDHATLDRSWSGPDFTAGFHTFAMSWSPRSIVWYVDGVERFRSVDHIPHEEMYVLVNLAVGGKFPGDPDAATPFPSYLEVDHVRAWKDPDVRPPSADGRS